MKFDGSATLRSASCHLQDMMSMDLESSGKRGVYPLLSNIIDAGLDIMVVLFSNKFTISSQIFPQKIL
jgi:hypothetical protein